MKVPHFANKGLPIRKVKTSIAPLVERAFPTLTSSEQVIVAADIAELYLEFRHEVHNAEQATFTLMHILAVLEAIRDSQGLPSLWILCAEDSMDCFAHILSKAIWEIEDFRE